MSLPPDPGGDPYGTGQGGGPYPPPQAGYGQPPGYAPPPGYQPVDPTLAEWWQRLVARLIDNAITTLASFLVIAALVFALGGITDAYDRPDGSVPAFVGIIAWLLVFLVLLGVPFLYEWLMLRSGSGKTLGKMIFKIQPVNVATRQPLTSREAAKRAAFYPVLAMIASLITCNLFVYLDGLWPLWDKPLAQALHDKPARTVVIKTGVPAGAAPPGYYPQ